MSRYSVTWCVFSLAVLGLSAGCGKVTGGLADAAAPGGSHDGGTDAGTDTGTDAPPELRQVTVAVEVGGGGGSVTSDVGGVSCGQACSAMVLDGTPITFTAVTPGGSAFMGWRGDAKTCGARTTCVVNVAGAALNVGARFAQKGTAAWNVQIGSLVSDSARVVGDNDGNSYLLASHGGDIMFDGTPVAGGVSILAKLSPAGDVLWKRSLSADAGFLKLAVVPSTGDIALLGTYSKTVDLGGPSTLTLPGADTGDYFAVKYAGSDGHFLWQHPIHLDDTDDPGVQGFAVSAAGDVLVAGAFNTSFNLGDGSVTTTAGLAEAFMGVLASADGAVQWKKRIGGADSGIFINDAAFDSNGFVILGGNFANTMNLGGAVLTPNGAGRRDAFVARFFGATGQLSWQRQVGGTGDDSVEALVVDTNNNVTVAVQYEVIATEAVTFAGNTLTGTGTGTDIVIGQVSSVNGFNWAKRYGGSGGATPAGFDVPTDLVLLADGNLALAGYFYSASLAFGGTTLSNAGLTDAFVARLSIATGDASFVSRLFGTGFDTVTSVGRAGNNVVVAGGFQNQTDFVGTLLTAAGGQDGYTIAVPLP